MIDSNPPGSTRIDSALPTPNQLPRRRSLWPWFAAGFLLVFVGMTLVVNMYWMDPSGEFIARGKLWEYYLAEIRRATNSPRTLGPATGSTEAAVSTAFQHVLTSAVGGAILLGIGWGVRKIKARK
jgi:hypothetical protein